MIKDKIGYRRRELMFRIIDNRKDVHPIAHRLHFLQEHFPQHLLDLALQWLVANNIIGLRFLMWFNSECCASDLQMHEKLLRVTENVTIPSIVAGKNFRV